jgi:hypothetical protein
VDNIKIRIKSGNNEFEAEGPSAEVEKHMEIWRREVSGLAKLPESADPTNAYYFDPGRDGLTLRKAPGIGPKGRKLADALLLILHGYRELQAKTQVEATRIARDLRESGYNDLAKLARSYHRLQKEGLAVRSGRGKGTRYRLTEPGQNAASTLARSFF